MANWLEKEIGKENIPCDVTTFAKDRTALELTTLAATLDTGLELHQRVHHDWQALVTMLTENNAPSEFIALIQAVRTHERLHDKFWRYIELFCNVVHNSNEK